LRIKDIPWFPKPHILPRAFHSSPPFTYYLNHCVKVSLDLDQILGTSYIVSVKRKSKKKIKPLKTMASK